MFEVDSGRERKLELDPRGYPEWFRRLPFERRWDHPDRK
jgi:hypothetical protein